MVLLLLAVVGCDSSSPAQSDTTQRLIAPGHAAVEDLVRTFGAAEALVDTAEIDIGTAAAQPHLVEGWGVDESLPDGTTRVWAMGGFTRRQKDRSWSRYA